MARRNSDIIKLRGGIWYENFTVAGVRYRRSLETDDEELARIKATKNKSDAYLRTITGEKPKRAQMTLDAALGRDWIEHCHGLRSAEVIKRRATVLRRGLGANTLLSDLTPAVLSAYAAGRAAGKTTHMPNSKRSGKPVAGGTVNAELHYLHAMLERADELWKVEVPEIKKKQWKKIFLKERGTRQNILSSAADDPDSEDEGEEERLFAELRPSYRAIVLFLLITGLRLRTVLYLTWRQVKSDHLALRIKGDKEFHPPISTEMRAILVGERGRHPIYVFTWMCQRTCRHRKRGVYREKGKRYPFTAGRFYSEFNRAREAAGLYYEKKAPENFRPHDLRHTAGTRMLGATGNLRTVQEFLGHENIQTTVRYAKTFTKDVRAGMELVSSTRNRHRVIRNRKKI